jgi:hypothetical protein
MLTTHRVTKIMNSCILKQAIGRDQENQEGLKLNRTHHLWPMLIKLI